MGIHVGYLRHTLAIESQTFWMKAPLIKRRLVPEYCPKTCFLLPCRHEVVREYGEFPDQAGAVTF